MAEESTSSSSGSSHPTLLLSERKPSIERSFRLAEFAYDSEGTIPRPHGSWGVRFNKKIASKYPRSYTKMTRILKYLRGPRPKVDLPGLKFFLLRMPPSHSISPEPNPLLDIDFNKWGLHINLPLESVITRLTRSLTKTWLLLLLGAAYIIGFAFFSRAQSFLDPPSSYIGCTAAYWVSKIL